MSIYKILHVPRRVSLPKTPYTAVVPFDRRRAYVAGKGTPVLNPRDIDSLRQMLKI